MTNKSRHVSLFVDDIDPNFGERCCCRSSVDDVHCTKVLNNHYYVLLSIGLSWSLTWPEKSFLSVVKEKERRRFQNLLRKYFKLGLFLPSTKISFKWQHGTRQRKPAELEDKDSFTRTLIPWCLLKWQNQNEIWTCLLWMVRTLVSMHQAKILRKILPEIDTGIIASGLQLVILAFPPGDSSEWVRGCSLHLFSHLNSSLWLFHSWHIRPWPRSAQDTPSDFHCSVFLI